VIGGTIFQGKLKVGEEMEIRPGVRLEEQSKADYEPLLTEIVSLHAGGKSVQEAYCGGLVGVGTLLDPSLTKADGLIGNVAGKPEMLPPTVSELTLESFFFERVIGTKELIKVEKVENGEMLLLDVGTTITAGNVVSVRDNLVTIKLGRPVCTEEGLKAAISRKIAGRWRLIGYGIVK